MSKPPFLDLPAGVRAYRLATARGEFAVHDTGDTPATAGHTALLLPGFTGSKEDFIGLLEPLARAGVRAVAVDQRGQFETGGPRAEGAYTQEELAGDVLALADALLRERPGEPVHLLGHSLGGLIARAAVLRAPSGFASLTVLSSGPAAVSDSQRERLNLLLSALPAMSMEAIWNAMRELDQSLGAAGEAPYSEREAEEIPPLMADFLRHRWLSNIPEQLAATGRQLMTEPDRVGELAALPLPFHVVSGAQDDAWPVPLLDGMAVRLGARRSVVADTGHSPNAERPGETARILADFWLSLCPVRTA
ncbi:alpha/beta fold hydrolase [Streptomyces iconiensis]|uniref:Alpha/beta fold hydrolase n=1 Tax=Streptomyces iconiensis TaxID=1384038 RepID=A0ABT7A5Q1_9ACTN|nr:alpha/beta fold hydrolase [Streptomyces iconiensis]MDJ1136673.1 alpha/beta fold hydrolase [Streptomyces iconiensis]